MHMYCEVHSFNRFACGSSISLHVGCYEALREERGSPEEVYYFFGMHIMNLLGRSEHHWTSLIVHSDLKDCFLSLPKSHFDRESLSLALAGFPPFIFLF